MRNPHWRKCVAPIVLAVLALAVDVSSAGATTVSFDTSAAKAMLSALCNPGLRLDQAMQVVRLRGNQGAIRKLREFGIAASDESFTEAIYATAHGAKITDPVEKSYLLDLVKSNALAIGRLVERIDQDPQAFQKAIEARIALYSPKDAEIHLQGFVIAGGDGGGYAFGGTEFYLNAGIVHDFTLARAITNHEMYHAVQGRFAKQRKVFEGDPDTSGCHALQRLFDNLYEEGSAVVVEDQSLVTQSDDPIAHRKQADLVEGVKHADESASLLEMSVDALQADPRMKYQDVYAVGFYGHGFLYAIGYVIAKALVASEGPNGLIKLLTDRSSQFVLDYINLPAYGLDSEHPRLMPSTIASAERLSAGCP